MAHLGYEEFGTGLEVAATIVAAIELAGHRESVPVISLVKHSQVGCREHLSLGLEIEPVSRLGQPRILDPEGIQAGFVVGRRAAEFIGVGQLDLAALVICVIEVVASDRPPAQSNRGPGSEKDR